MRRRDGFATGGRHRLLRVWAVALALGASRLNTQASLVWIDSSELEGLVRRVGLTNVLVLGANRNAAGTRLYVTARPMGARGQGALVVSVSRNGPTVEAVPARRYVLADDGRLSAFVTNHVLVFPGLATYALAPSTRCEFSPGGEFFFLFEPTNNMALGRPSPGGPELPAVVDAEAAAVEPGSASIFESARPKAPVVRLPPGLVPWSIFSRTNRVFVFGYKEHRTRRQGHLQQYEWGLVFDRRGSTLTLDRQIDMTRYGYVLDMDPSGAQVLVQYGNDLSQKCALLDMNTGKLHRIGRPRGYGLFLDPGVVDFLKSLRKP